MYSDKSDLRFALGFISGFDAAKDHGPLLGFREWLQNRFVGVDGPFSWMAIVQVVIDRAPCAEGGETEYFFEILCDFLHQKEMGGDNFPT